MMKNIIN